MKFRFCLAFYSLMYLESFTKIGEKVMEIKIFCSHNCNSRDSVLFT